MSDHTELSAEDIVRRANSNDPAARRELGELFDLFASEYEYHPVDIVQVPYGDFAVSYGRSNGCEYVLTILARSSALHESYRRPTILGMKRVLRIPYEWLRFARTLSGITCAVIIVACGLMAIRAVMEKPSDPNVGYSVSLDISSDGKVFAIGIIGFPKPHSQGVALWDVSHGKVTKFLPARLDDLQCVAMSRDGKYLVAAGGYGVAVWEVVTANKLWMFASRGLPIRSVAFSPNGKMIALGGVGLGVELWDTPTGKLLARVGPSGSDSDVSSVAFSCDGSMLAAGYSSPSCAKVWDVKTLTERLNLPHENSVWSVCFSPIDPTLATGSWDSSVELWDLASGDALGLISLSDQVNQVAFSESGRLLAIASERPFDPPKVRVWDLATRKELCCLENFDPTCEQVRFAFLRDETGVVTIDGKLKVWDCHTGQQRTMGHRGNWLRSIVLSGFIFAVLISLVAFIRGQPRNCSPD